MIAAPYYLLAIGIFILIGGYFLAAVAGPPPPNPINERMSDDKIAESLRNQESGHWTGLVILAGYGLTGASIIWRIVLIVLRFL